MVLHYINLYENLKDMALLQSSRPGKCIWELLPTIASYLVSVRNTTYGILEGYMENTQQLYDH
jgi:hypothetical protein